MVTPFKRQSSQISDIQPVSQPKVFRQPERVVSEPQEVYREPQEWYIPEYVETAPSKPEPASPIVAPLPLKINRAPFFRRRRRFVSIGVIVFCIGIGILLVIERVSGVKNEALMAAEQGYQDLALAVEDVQSEKFTDASAKFNNAHLAFTRGSDSLSLWGGPLLNVTKFIPGLSKIASGKNALDAGNHFALAGIALTQIAKDLSFSKEAYTEGEKISLLDFLSRAKKPLTGTLTELEAGSQALENVQITDIPQEKQEQFLLVRKDLPTFVGLIKSFNQHEALFEELFGGNGPRKYLFLLQNNQEIRATGGFIGSYALLDVNNGVVRRFFVDGIFNPDGQLRENVVPPKAIQKVSAAWSLHDSNWFPDFPTSAEKAMYFYEKTGGPTVDGVITLTPTVLQRLLTEIGPLSLPQYGLTVDADNFIPIIQEQVETKYDKQENQPKKVLNDLFSLLLEKVFTSQDTTTLYGIANALVSGLNEKQMLLYIRHSETEALIDEAGWSGRVLPSSKDYLSVINSNINGYKTDGVIDENIKHTAEISADGSIVDTVTITRTHHGGNTPYAWWNKVNADYLRVYVPLGSTLLSAKGATWEFPPAPLDYQALGFHRDADVEREENSTVIDEKSGTRIYQDAGKTVFGAWTYVSPQESVTIEYRYKVPVTLDMNQLRQGGADSYAVLYQKQSGSIGSKLASSVIFPQDIKPVWQTDGNLVPYEGQWKLDTDLKTDVFVGLVFGATVK